MGYQGRIVSFLASLSLFCLYMVMHRLQSEWPMLFLSAFYVMLSVWLGGRYDAMKYKAERDVLTKLYNRSFVYDRLPNLLKKHHSLSVFIIDVDDFKRINDTYGHDTGDQVLARIASVLQRQTRKTDIVVRWGGDEFLLIMPDAPSAFAASLRGGINIAMRELVHEFGFEVKVSVGSCNANNAMQIEQMIKEADENMYCEKQAKWFNRPQVE
ncbi:diguanylate cyclase [Anoxybacteroides tepidamans]|uniref:diguanylate cyclase n=1 Tax=Anoxybacteroides tepidamans TaxID=265948 RepID=UPI00068825E8|nr:diguanylate cyclase [Anoxybacillus tepidamans]